MMTKLEFSDVGASRIAASSGGNDIFAAENLPDAIRIGQTTMQFGR
jgi:hypothetical protein